jgi:hypothetical protein
LQPGKWGVSDLRIHRWVAKGLFPYNIFESDEGKLFVERLMPEYYVASSFMCDSAPFFKAEQVEKYMDMLNEEILGNIRTALESAVTVTLAYDWVTVVSREQKLV